MNKHGMSDIEMLQRYLDGSISLADDEFESIILNYEEDLAIGPNADDWRYHGYSSYNEWYEANKESLDAFAESLRLRGPLVEQARKKRREDSNA